MSVIHSIILLFFLVFAGTSICTASSSLTIIINPETEQKEVSRQGLRAIFSMRWQTWNDGTPIQVFVLNDSHRTHTDFTRQYIGVLPHQLRKAWDRMVFSGTGQAPSEVTSVEEMIEKVSSTPGAIGYITSDKLNESIKSITVK